MAWTPTPTRETTYTPAPFDNPYPGKWAETFNTQAYQDWKQ